MVLSSIHQAPQILFPLFGYCLCATVVAIAHGCMRLSQNPALEVGVVGGGWVVATDAVRHCK